MEESRLAGLEARTENMEMRIFGEADKDVCYPKDAPQIADTLRSVMSQISAAVAGRPNIEATFKRIAELSQYLDSEYVDRLTQSPQAKLDLILAEEPARREQAALLEQVENLVKVLDSEHIKAVPSYQDRLQELSRIHILQQDSAAELSEEMSVLLAKYNNIIALLSKQFVDWDELVTRMEIAARPKPVVD